MCLVSARQHDHRPGRRIVQAFPLAAVAERQIAYRLEGLTLGIGHAFACSTDGAYPRAVRGSKACVSWYVRCLWEMAPADGLCIQTVGTAMERTRTTGKLTRALPKARKLCFGYQAASRRKEDVGGVIRGWLPDERELGPFRLADLSPVAQARHNAGKERPADERRLG